MHLIDSHCHLYLPDFKEDIESVILRARENGVTKFYLPAIDSEVTEAMFDLEKRFPGECIAMMGLHPCSVKENYKNELDQVYQWLQKRTFAAVGEIGLDFYWDKSFTQQQYDAFETQLQWALEKNLPVVIHTRNAMKETIDAVKPFSEKGLKGIFHCFGGTKEEAIEIVDMNFLLGIGGVITYKNANLAETLCDIDLSFIVLETDSPYLTPVPHRGKRNESSYLTYIASKLAEIKNVTIEEVAEATTTNVKNLLG